MSEDLITLKIKMTMNNILFDVPISKSSTVLELKTKSEEQSKIKPEEQNLVYKGRILADEKLLSDYNIQNDHTIILVKKYTEPKGKFFYYLIFSR